MLGVQFQARRLAPAARGGIPVDTRIPASERTSQKLSARLTHGVADGVARAELLKLAVRKIVEEALHWKTTPPAASVEAHIDTERALSPDR